MRLGDDRSFCEAKRDPAATRTAPVLAPAGAAGVAARAWGLAALAFAALAVTVLSFRAAAWHLSDERTSGLTFAGGIVAAAVAGLAVFVAIRRQARQIAANARHLAAMEALHGVSAAVSGRLGDGTGREPLAQLCAATLTLLHLDRSGILLLDAARDRLELLASAGDMPGDAPRFYPLPSLPVCRGVLAGRDVLFIEDSEVPPPSAVDGAAAAAAANADVVAFFRARSIVLIPLHVEGHCIGLMTLSGSSPRTFDDAERRLAGLMGAQASVILANARLIAQTRGAAEQARAALVAHKAMLEQRDALTNVLRAGSFEESMLRIVQLAPATVGVDRAGIGLTTAREGELVMVAVTQGRSNGVLGLPQDVSPYNSGRALRERRTLVIEHAGVEGGIHPAFRDELATASLVYAPLFAAAAGDTAAAAPPVVTPAGRPIGLLIFVRDRPGSFSAEQMELMRAFCVRAAGVIETARLLDQTRDDARAKTVLLRELNHRVKNNLAGIVALLTVARPDLTPDAERWLARATDRIHAMATAHDLFTGDVPAVTLPDLLRRTLTSMPLPAGVGVRQGVDDAAAYVRLDTSRAVTLAMVVNELCHNALVHGLGAGGGTIEVSARVRGGDAAARPTAARENGNGAGVCNAGNGSGNAGGGRVVIEVADDGRGCVGDAPTMADPFSAAAAGRGAASVGGTPPANGACDGRRKGVGLELVGGLVTRELRGRFSLGGRAGGGVVARVEFDVPTDEVPVLPAGERMGVVQ